MTETELIDKFRSIEERFKSVETKVDRVYDFNSSINTKLELLKKDMENMQKQSEDTIELMQKQSDSTTSAIKELSIKFDELKDKPKNSVWNTIVEGKKTIITLGIGIGAAYFWEHIIAFLQKLFK